MLDGTKIRFKKLVEFSTVMFVTDTRKWHSQINEIYNYFEWNQKQILVSEAVRNVSSATQLQIN